LKLRLTLCLIVLLASSGVSRAANVIDKFIPLTVSIPPINLKQNEQVISFEFLVIDGAILNFSPPFLWKIDLDNGDSNRARLTADAYLGDYALGPNDLGYFRDFVVIGKPRSGFAGLAPFNVMLKLSIAPKDDFSHSRIVTLEMKQLKIKSTTLKCK
jgi:hypothetical protein